jgi:hypothetical protein
LRPISALQRRSTESQLQSRPSRLDIGRKTLVQT